MKPAIFIDRDGVLNHNGKSKPGGPKYVLSWDQWEWIDGALDALRLLSETEYELVIVSNQMCVGLGLIDICDMYMLFGRIVRELKAKGISVTSYFCPHHWQDRCACRKPKPGMIFHAAVEHGIQLGKSWMIGDGDSDMKAGWNAGIRRLIRIRDMEPRKLRDYSRTQKLRLNVAGGYPQPSLMHAAKLILAQDAL